MDEHRDRMNYQKEYLSVKSLADRMEKRKISAILETDVGPLNIQLKTTHSIFSIGVYSSVFSKIGFAISCFTVSKFG